MSLLHLTLKQRAPAETEDKKRINPFAACYLFVLISRFHTFFLIFIGED